MLFSIIGKIQPDCPKVSVTVVKTERVNKKAFAPPGFNLFLSFSIIN